MNLESDSGIKYRLDYVNKRLAGKTIKGFSSEGSTRAFVEFTDGSIGMIEILNENGKESYLAIMPPADISESLRRGSNSLGMPNVQDEPRR